MTRTISMLRKTTLALFAVLLTAATSHAAIILSGGDVGTDLGNGLKSFTISAVGTAGEVINTIQDPLIVGKNGGLGPHQVWVPVTNGHTATKSQQDSGAPLW